MEKHVLVVFSILVGLITALSFAGNVSASEYASVSLSELSQNTDAPIEQRIAATIELGNISDQNSIIGIGRASRDEVVELRLAAIRAVEHWQHTARWDVISPLLNDPVAKVRYAAALAIVRLWPMLNSGQQQMIDEQVEAYILTVADTDEALLERAYLYRVREDYEQAEIVFTLLLNRQSDNEEFNTVMYLEYVELLKSTGRNRQAIKLLEGVVKEYQTSGELYFSLGLAYYRENNITAAITNINAAHELNSNDARVSYALALLTKEQDPATAVALLSQAYQVSKQPRYLYSLCELQLKLKVDASSCLADLRLLVPSSVVDDLMFTNQ